MTLDLINHFNLGNLMAQAHHIIVSFPPQISHVEQLLKDPTRALGTYGLKDGDVVVLRQADKRPPPTQPAFPGKKKKK